MGYKFIVSMVLAFGVGPGLLIYGIALKLRYIRLKKHGKRANADVESVIAHQRSVQVDLSWTDSGGNRREEMISLPSGLFGAAIGKKMEIYYNDSHVVAVGRRPYVLYMVIGPICIALGIVAVLTLNY